MNGNALKKTLRFLRKVFPYYSSAKHPKLKCGYCHLDLCPHFTKVSRGKPGLDLAKYKKDIKKFILVLQGKSKTVLNSLKKEMKFASVSQDFEKAGKIRDQIFALEKVMSHSETRMGSDPSQIVWGQTPAKVLQEILDFENKITRIECYDVSNIQGKFAVGSMVVFVNGKPDKSQYKKFKIKGNSSSTNFRDNKYLTKNNHDDKNNKKLVLDKPNDIAMLKEVLQRRFAHAEWKFPEIILIDGGKAQLNIAIKIKNQVLEQFHGIVPIVISIAKGKQELFIEGQKNPIPLKNLPQEIFNLIKNLDDQAHRFAITYHKKLRRQNLLK